MPSACCSRTAELAQPGDPARRVAGDQQGLVVDAGVAVGPVVAEHGEDHPRELVGRGDDGALVAPARGDGADIDGARRRQGTGASRWRGRARRIVWSSSGGPGGALQEDDGGRGGVDALLVDLFVEAHATSPAETAAHGDSTRF